MGQDKKQQIIKFLLSFTIHPEIRLAGAPGYKFVVIFRSANQRLQKGRCSATKQRLLCTPVYTLINILS
jgi:hypothetical protein